MQHFAIVVVGLFSVGTLGAWAGIESEASGEAATHRVTVGALCTDQGADSTWVIPWVLEIKRGDDVEWVLAEGTQVRNIVIRPKAQQAWPFAGSPPSGGPGNPARTGAANRLGRHQYDIQLTCVRPSGGTVPVVIDPDIIIGEE